MKYKEDIKSPKSTTYIDYLEINWKNPKQQVPRSSFSV